MNWYEDNDNVCELAHWLDDRCEFDTVSQAIYFFEKPWKWDEDYSQMRGMQAGTHGECPCGEITDNKDANGRFTCCGCEAAMIDELENA